MSGILQLRAVTRALGVQILGMSAEDLRSASLAAHIEATGFIPI